MKTKIYLNNEKFIAGITLKDDKEPEQNNMALHACYNAEDILQNRKKLATTLQCELENFVCANQTHSANYHKVTFADKSKGAHIAGNGVEDTDALYTYEPNMLLCSFTADCVPVIFYNEANNLIGTIHSGWQGTTKEITLKTLHHLIYTEKCQPHDLHIFIGPALSQEKFEVDEDVYIKFKNLGYADEFIYYNDHTKKYHIDNQQTVQKQCELAGIPSTQISIDRTCTFLNPHGFSYREDRECGRHLSFIMRKQY